ncbi:intraflagellar transport protein 46 homolog isoform X2 [Agrilus planipennis]|nr:intraflagellar transport protein 46 homolog isoform X2 [Agrilus planipennis]
MQREDSSKDSYSFKIVNNEEDEFQYEEGISAENSREIHSPVASYQQKYPKDFLHNSSGVNLDDSDSDDEVLIREPSANPRRFNSRLQKEEPQKNANSGGTSFEERNIINLPPNDQSTIEGTFTDSDSESENLARLDKKPIPGQYDPQTYEYLEVNSEIKELFQYITKYSPQQLNLDCKLKPFIPEYIPAVGDIDAFLKVIPPEKYISGEPFDSSEFQLGLAVLDEPSINQSDQALLHLQLRASTFDVGQNDETVVVKTIDRVGRNLKTIDKWVKDVIDLHKSKSAPVVRYSRPMPDLDDLMQEWPEEIESLLKIHGFPSSKLDCSLSSYIDVICSILDIPVHQNKIESLHLLFCLYAAIKNSQFYKSTSNNDDMKASTTNQPDQLLLE